eukprot:7279154-Prymnesium_polylepis.1
MSGAPKRGSQRLDHLRYAHVNDDDLGRVTGRPSSRKCPCPVCKIFKAVSPSAYSTPQEKLANVVGERVALDAWTYKVPAVGTGWTYILGGVDKYSDAIDARGSLQPNGVRCAAFVEWLFVLYGMQYG